MSKVTKIDFLQNNSAIDRPIYLFLAHCIAQSDSD